MTHAKEIVDAFVHGTPKPQPRPRAFVRPNGRAGVYDAGTAEGWKSQIAKELESCAGLGLTSAVDLRVAFYFPRPKSHYGTGKNAGVLKKSAPEQHTTKPDVDNLVKAVKDTLGEKSGIGLWKDDKQVVSVLAKKFYADPGQPAGMRIVIVAES